jgi:hypothetical protein
MKIESSDFSISQYFEFYQYCKGKFAVKLIGDKKVGFSAMVVDGYAPFRVSFSANEQKFYFDTFRVFTLDDAQKYADFKFQEVQLINSIEG